MWLFTVQSVFGEADAPIVVDLAQKPDSGLRARVTAATNKAEAYNGFSAWTRFGKQGVIAGNDPAEQEKSVKWNSLLCNLIV
jgi:TnpA family transposase